jgi:CreA protein
MKKLFFLVFMILIFPTILMAEEIGSIDTAFKLLGSNHSVKIEAFDDPKVDGVTCYLSRSVTGGLSGLVGLSSEKTEFSIACRQVAPIKFTSSFDKKGESVFSEARSPFFKKINVIRMLDSKRNVLTYTVVTTYLIDGSPKNSISVVPIR